MQVKCKNCGEEIQTSEPKTIEELKDFCKEKNLPLEQMRFFIGENYTGPKAFGIYENDAGEYVVYKNKADGTRAIRYQGDDEAYAVNELYQKMRLEIRQRKQSQTSNPAKTAEQDKTSYGKKLWIGIAAFIALAACGFIWAFTGFDDEPETGYYTCENTPYYYDAGSWYCWDGEADAWEPAYIIDDDLADHYADYYDSSEYSPWYDASSFEDSEYYDNSRDSRDSDDGWSWDSSNSSWDSGDTNWDSDW